MIKHTLVNTVRKYFLLRHTETTISLFTILKKVWRKWNAIFVTNCLLDHVIWETIWQHTKEEKGRNIKYQCTTCPKGFVTIKLYDRHMKTYEGESFMSTKCEFKTHSKELINSHNIIHIGKMPFSCTNCFKQFKHNPSFTFHKRTHTEERPYKWNQCSKEFTQIIHLLTNKEMSILKREISCVRFATHHLTVMAIWKFIFKFTQITNFFNVCIV